MQNYLITILSLITSFTLNAQFLSSEVDSVAAVTLQKTKTNGAYISISQNDSIIYSSSFGYNDINKKSKFTDSTLFPISSNTKAFNSILLSQLVEKKQISFDTALINYLPNLLFEDKYITNTINLTDLLTHRYSFPRYDFTFFLLSEEEQKNPNEAVFKKLKYLKSTFPFRTKFQYGNNQYILAAYLLERVTSNKWEDQLTKELLTPLQMHDTHCSLDVFLSDDKKSLGYQNQYLVDIKHSAPLYSVSGMGNMFSTIRDLEKWSSFLLYGNDSILSKPLITNTYTSHFNIGYEEPFDGFSNMEYGFGWFIFDYFGHKVVLHHGDNVGHKSMIVLLPDDNISWSIIANEGMAPYGFPFIMSFSLLDKLLGREINDWNTKLHIESPPAYLYANVDLLHEKEIDYQPQQYIGTYENDGFGTINILFEKGKLYVHAGGYTDELIYWSENNFKSIAEEFQEEFYFHFLKNDNNQVISFKTNLIEPSVAELKFTKKL